MADLYIIKKKLEKLESLWEHYIQDLQFFQARANYTAEQQTNYFADIVHYLNDTFDLLKTGKSTTFSSHISNAIVLLQVVYVQQDLMDELLHIFKLPQSLQADKKVNRELRNELIGHPVRRLKTQQNEFTSSVFFAKNLSSTTIHYILYAKNNRFKGVSKYYSKQEIIDTHKDFLNKYIDVIIVKMDKCLVAYKKHITTLSSLIATGVSFIKIVKLAFQLYEKIINDNYLFKETILLQCHQLRQTHPRYQFATDLFLNTLARYIEQEKENIDELLKNNFKKKRYHKSTEFEIIFDEAPATNTRDLDNEKNYLRYELGKLHEKKYPSMSLDYLKERFRSDAAMMAELLNMEIHLDNELEFYCSYEYFKKLAGLQEDFSN